MKRLVGFALLAACSSEPVATTPTDTGVIEDDEDVLPKCEAAVSKGPWVVAVDETHAKVRWESCRAGGGALTIDGKSFASSVREAIVATTNHAPLRKLVDPPGTYFMHEVALSELSPGTCYAYTLGQDDTAKGRFCTARASGELSFAVIGDTNPGLGAIERLLEVTYGKQPDFTVHTGDIQYYSSGLETYGYWMEKMRPMLRTGAFLPSIGNHESEQPGERAEYVDRFFGDPGFDGSKDDFYYRFHTGGVWFFALNTEIDLGDKSPQGVWLDAQLRDAAARPGYRFSVLYMHRPFVTCGDKAQNDALRARYLPLFTETKVKLVLAGHMHGYERFELDGITWITSGGGGGGLGKIDENKDRPECASRKAAGAFWDASVITVRAGELSGITFDDKGATRDTFTMPVP